MKLINSTQQLPKVYFGLHMSPGVAEYNESGKEMYRILVNEDAIRSMNKSFTGRPVYVDHVEGVDLGKIREEADGFVVESFYNAIDGKTWVRFIIVSDKGHEAIRSGWKLSNAYIPKSFGGGGLWHGVEYDKEVMSGEYEHLAIVQNPRYAESIVLDEEQFKAYNSKKEIELQRLSNSKKEKKVGLLNLFKKEKIENSADLESTSVILPTSKKEMTISEVVEVADKILNMHGYASGDHLVKVGDEEMSVNDLAQKYGAMMEEKKKNEEDAKKKAEEEAAAAAKKNDDEVKKEDEPKKNEQDDQDDEEQKKKNFETLKNAHLSAKADVDKVDLSQDKVARGKVRYGSK